MFRLRPPLADELNVLLAQQSDVPLDYPTQGGTLIGQSPTGFRPDQYEVELGAGYDVWTAAVTALHEWTPHRESEILVAVDGPIASGTNVVMCAPLPFGYAVVCCRIVDVVDEPDRFGFAYGTLPMHPEQGEELFLVTHDPDGRVRFSIIAFSRPSNVLTRVGAPIARWLQVHATRRYLDAMVKAMPR